jgi:peptide deformylase
MAIITVPHPTLRQTAQPIDAVDKKVLQLLEELKHTLRTRKNPQGVGLAAPQIDASKRVFATFLPDQNEGEDAPSQMRIFINPEIIDHSSELTLGPDEKHPLLEGCLSIPGLWGPIPRWIEVKLKYQEVVDGILLNREAFFSEFHARVIQHELDHLNGILFTDYSLRFDLPVYKGSDRNDSLEEIDRELLELF